MNARFSVCGVDGVAVADGDGRSATAVGCSTAAPLRNRRSPSNNNSEAASASCRSFPPRCRLPAAATRSTSAARRRRRRCATATDIRADTRADIYRGTATAIRALRCSAVSIWFCASCGCWWCAIAADWTTGCRWKAPARRRGCRPLRHAPALASSADRRCCPAPLGPSLCWRRCSPLAAVGTTKRSPRNPFKDK